MKTLIVIPAYNEASVIGSTIQAVMRVAREMKDADILVVNDGSSDGTGSEISKHKVFQLTHKINRGLGGAIGTGLEFARSNGYKLFITIDADGQHDPEDIKKLAGPIIKGDADVVIGSRTISNRGKIPGDRKFMIWASNLVTFILFGQKTTDSVSGFRAFGELAIKNVQIKTEQMEVSNELFSEIKRLKLRLTELPIKIIYTDYSRAKGQSNSNAINIITKLFLRLFR